MINMPEVAAGAALVGDPSRGRMLTALMDGRARTAIELALEAGVAQSTASSHLARLSAAGLVSTAKQGRHRYFHLAGQEVADALEALMRLAVRRTPERTRPGPRDPDLRHARVCYDHLAGEAGVHLLERLRQRHLIGGDDQAVTLTGAGEMWCRRVGIDLDMLRVRRRPLCRSCLDWSERRMHLAGALGAALLDRMFALRYARRERGRRAVSLAPAGERFIERLQLAR